MGLLTLGWLVSFIAFWAWWLQPTHRYYWSGLIFNSVLLFYLSALPVGFLIVVNRLHKVNPDLAIPDLRVAFVVTKAPSEPWDVASKTIKAMLNQRFPNDYDVWLCDEDPTDEVLVWCSRHNVNVSTRRGVESYHQTHWPRRTKCKEGNLAYFYDNWGYTNYDVVAQLDCDHVPDPTYLAEVVRPFSDPSIGYVAAPSVNDSNGAESWAARGRLHREATFHGPFQLGHGNGLASLCIGSHYAVRTAALRRIGGVGPELAEDFSTSFLLTSAGWQSAFAHTAEAHGEGPRTFAALVTQEFQWSRSLTTLLLETVPRHLPRLPWRLRIRFIFALSYYPFLALTTVSGLALPVVAAVTGVPWVRVNYFEFLARFMLMGFFMIAITMCLRRRGLLRPAAAPVLSWENWMYAFARWPFVTWGVVAAVLQRVRPKPVVFRVTPKTAGGLEPLSAGLVLPFGVISAVLSTGALIGEATTDAVGYVFLCALGATSYAIITAAVPLLHAREATPVPGTSILGVLRVTVAKPLAVASGAWILAIIAIAGFPAYALHFVR